MKTLTQGQMKYVKHIYFLKSVHQLTWDQLRDYFLGKRLGRLVGDSGAYTLNTTTYRRSAAWYLSAAEFCGEMSK